MAARQFASATTRSIKRATSELAAVAVRGWGFTTKHKAGTTEKFRVPTRLLTTGFATPGQAALPMASRLRGFAPPEP